MLAERVRVWVRGSQAEKSEARAKSTLGEMPTTRRFRAPMEPRTGDFGVKAPRGGGGAYHITFFHFVLSDCLCLSCMALGSGVEAAACMAPRNGLRGAEQ